MKINDEVIIVQCEPMRPTIITMKGGNAMSIQDLGRRNSNEVRVNFYWCGGICRAQEGTSFTVEQESGRYLLSSVVIVTFNCKSRFRTLLSTQLIHKMEFLLYFEWRGELLTLGS